jgi:hypothetical protein
MYFSKKLILPAMISFLFVFLLSGCIQDVTSDSEEAASTPPEEAGDPEEDPAEDIGAEGPVVDGIIARDEYASSLTDDTTGIELFWTHDNRELFMGIKTGSSGWVSVGFDPQSAMKGANIIFLALDGGAVLVRDDFGTSSFGHDDDERLGGSTDIGSSAGSRDGNLSVYEFSIPLDSGDEFDKVLSPGNTYRVILAVNNSGTDFDRKHSARSSVDMQLD